MAIAFLSPQDRAKVERQEDQYRRMSSADPIERYRAKEEAFTELNAELSRTMIQQARQKAAAFERQERERERAERNFYKYKPLPPGAKITK